MIGNYSYNRGRITGKRRIRQTRDHPINRFQIPVGFRAEWAVFMFGIVERTQMNGHERRFPLVQNLN